jgi:hypothetical protein
MTTSVFVLFKPSSARIGATVANLANSKKSPTKAALSAKAKSAGTGFNGFLQDNDSWRQDYIDGKRGPEAKYLAQG